jgi:hypothetical protein
MECKVDTFFLWNVAFHLSMSIFKWKFHNKGSFCIMVESVNVYKYLQTLSFIFATMLWVSKHKFQDTGTIQFCSRISGLSGWFQIDQFGLNLFLCLWSVVGWLRSLEKPLRRWLNFVQFGLPSSNRQDWAYSYCECKYPRGKSRDPQGFVKLNALRLLKAGISSFHTDPAGQVKLQGHLRLKGGKKRQSCDENATKSLSKRWIYESERNSSGHFCP